MPATTPRASPTSWRACPSKFSAGCAPTVSFAGRPRPASMTPGRPAPQARRRVRLRCPGYLGNRAGRDRHRHPPLRKGDRTGLGPTAPQAHQTSGLAHHDGPLPLIEGTVIRLRVEHLPSGGENKPVWLRWSRTDATPADIDRCWQSFLRRFDLEHTFRMIKQTLGWTKPRLRSAQAADRWTWLVVVAHTRLRLARPLATDLRRPWEKPAEPNRLTPARVRRGFRNLRAKMASPARAPKPSRPGPGRPPDSKNRRAATRQGVGRVLATGEAFTRPATTRRSPSHGAWGKWVLPPADRVPACRRMGYSAPAAARTCSPSMITGSFADTATVATSPPKPL